MRQKKSIDDNNKHLTQFHSCIYEMLLKNRSVQVRIKVRARDREWIVFPFVLRSDEHLCLALLACLEPGQKSGDTQCHLWQIDVSVT